MLFFNLLLELIHSFQVFTSAVALGGSGGGAGGPADSLLVYTWYLYEQGFRNLRMGYASAMAWMLMLGIGLLTALLFRTQRSWVHYVTPAATARRRTARTLAWHAGALTLLAVILYPVVWLVGASLKPGDEIVGSLELLPGRPIADNYRRLTRGIADIPVSTFFTNSLVLAVGSVVGVLISCSLAAYAFARIRFAGRKLLFAVMISTLLLPFQVLIIPQYVLFQKLGLINTYVPLLLGNTSPRTRSSSFSWRNSCAISRGNWTRRRAWTAADICASIGASCSLCAGPPSSRAPSSRSSGPGTTSSGPCCT